VGFLVIRRCRFTAEIFRQISTYEACDVDVCFQHIADVARSHVVDTVLLQAKCVDAVVILRDKTRNHQRRLKRGVQTTSQF